MLELRGLDPTQPDADLPALRAVTAQDVARVAKEYFSFEKEVTAIAR